MRSLRKAPLFTVAVVATLSLAIGANTLIFSVVHGVILRPLAFGNADGIRLALGAGEVQVVELVVGQGLRLAGIGLAIGLVAAFFGSHVLGSLLYGIHPTDSANVRDRVRSIARRRFPRVVAAGAAGGDH